MSKHTQGKWFTDRPSSYGTIYIECRIGQGLLQEVAAVGPTANGTVEQEANARLMAAAPDLLHALEMAEEVLCRLERIVDRGEDDSINLEPEILSARAAIAKAKGEQA